jgi:hypothetical protein
MRPPSITAVEGNLEDLSRLGGIASSCPYSHWLHIVGAVQDCPNGEWLYTDVNWLVAATPASGPLDLLRRTAVLDPQYRFHLDILLAQVLHTIGSSARWSRFEELVFGPLLGFAPRFVQLLGYAATAVNTNLRDLSSTSWQKLVDKVEGNEHGIFQSWDRDLWGDVPGGAAAIFPLLVDLYVPLRQQGCTVAIDEYLLDGATGELLMGITERARFGEGMTLAADSEPLLRTLLDLGLPIRESAPAGLSADRRPIVGLVEPIRVIWSGSQAARFEGTPLSGIDRAALKSAQIDGSTVASSAGLVEGFWTVVERSFAATAFPGLKVSEGWPTNPSPAPVWAQIPPAGHLMAIASARRESAEADQALFVLARHLLFGLLLQTLLLESLDRELGYESLALTPSPPNERGVSDIRVFYRPTREHNPSADERITPQTYEIGTFDDVVDSIAAVLGITPAGITFTGEGRGFWTMGLELLASLGLVNLSASKDRWILHADVLDRLHGGGLMSGVLRKGKGVRDRIRSHLQDLWSASDDLNRQNEAPNA